MIWIMLNDWCAPGVHHDARAGTCFAPYSSMLMRDGAMDAHQVVENHRNDPMSFLVCLTRVCRESIFD